MEKIKLGLYEIFAYLIPGNIFITAIVLLFSNNENPIGYILDLVKSQNATQVIGLLILSFFIGFCNQYISFKIFQYISVRIWKKRLNSNTIKLNKYESQFVAIRHLSPNNYQLIEKWMAFRGMCYNSFYSIFILFLTLLYLMIEWNAYRQFDLWLIIILSLMFSILSLRRGVSFHEWSINSIESTMKFIKEQNIG